MPPFRWGMRLPGQFEDYVYVHDEAELVAVLLGRTDYLYLDPQAALIERILFSVRTQCWQQARLNLIAQTYGVGDWEDAEPWQREVLSGTRVTQPHGWPTKAEDLVDRWDCRVPLILVSTAFAPYGEVSPPVGEEVWWIDPIEDATLLSSLEDLPFRLIDVFAVNQRAVQPIDEGI